MGCPGTDCPGTRPAANPGTPPGGGSGFPSLSVCTVAPDVLVPPDAASLDEWHPPRAIALIAIRRVKSVHVNERSFIVAVVVSVEIEEFENRSDKPGRFSDWVT